MFSRKCVHAAWVAGITVTLIAGSEGAQARPPARGHASPTLYANLDGGTDSPGVRFLNTLSADERGLLRRDSQVVLKQQGKSGETVMIRAVVRFNKPMNEVFARLSRTSEQHTFLPHVEQSKTIGAPSDEGELNDYVVSMIFTFKYRTQHWFYPDEQRIEWVLDSSGGDSLSEQEGSWQLFAFDEKTTIAEYSTHIAARSAVLNFFRSLGERGGVADALTAIRKHIDAGQTK